MSSDVESIFENDDAREAGGRLLDAIEKWALSESQGDGEHLTGFGVVITDSVLNLEKLTAADCERHAQLIKAVERATDFVNTQHHRFDKQIDDLHSKFKKEIDELDLKIVSDKAAFKNYLHALMYSEEYFYLGKKLNHLLETIKAKKNYKS